ncbi:MAG: PfkB family carbohydrate kinase [Candidatus Electryoneaceae bacterium]|nr:PfkB family carbohydrate kinase [Candidatus Electryoneaceae bacterium]
MNNSVTVVGSAALDTIETPYGRVEEALGGSVSYIGAVGSLFAPVNVVAVVGDDFPMDKMAFMIERGVNLEGLESEVGRTFRWEGRYHRNMNIRDTLNTELGVFAGFEPQLPEEAALAQFLMLANIDPTLQLDVLEQMESPLLVAFDTMNFWIESNREAVEEMLKRVHVVVVNDEEVRLLTGVESPFEGAEKLLEMGPRCVIVKKGEHGAILIESDKPPFLCPAYPVSHPKDPTGAGDTFAGGMMGYLASTGDIGSMNIRRAIVYGTVCASFTVEDFGLNRLERLTADEIEERYREFQTMVEF